MEERSLVHLDREETHHLFHVLRATRGEKVILLNGHGYYAEGHIHETQGIVIDGVHFAESSKITLCPALLKNKAMDFLIREATAIGVAKIIPIYTQNSEVKIQNVAEKQMHWNHIAREACKQSGNPYLPFIEMPRKLKDLACSMPVFVSALRGNPKNIFHYQSEIKNNPIAILVGPEGDFSEREYQYFEQSNFHFIHLGRYVLRAETAALYLLSVIDCCLRTAHP
ncbi:MAG: 16S rRNA (uracil(1498)-N(3))-methyltransferase [Puniceicoccales bacterium]|nr:16S rRNA (uracil(1498)-N(3))-methyltransferase [Puniceicoccales bacterium]